MAKSPSPYTLFRRTDSKTFRFSLNPCCGLPDSVCKQWYRRSFQSLPDELTNYRNPKTKPAAKTSISVLIAYLIKKMERDGEQRAAVGDTTVGEFAGDMFTDGAAHLKRWKEKGISLSPRQ